MIREKIRDNPNKILTGFGLFLGVLAVIYFGGEAILDLTPIAKSFLLIAGSGLFLLGSKLTDDRGSMTALYFFSAISYLTFMGYYTLRMNPSSTTVFLLLGISGLLFVLVGKKIESYRPEEEKLKKLGAGIVILSVTVIAVDLNGPEVQYQTDFRESIEVGQEPVNVGNITVQNSYFLPQIYDIDRVRTCSTEETRTTLTIEERSENSGVIDGSSEKNVKYIVRSVRRLEGNFTSEKYSIVTSENCPEQQEPQTLYVYQVPSPN